MKTFAKTLLACAAMLCAAGTQAQDLNILNHLAIGVNAGTTGIGVDVAVPVTRFLTVRPGYNFMPQIKADFDFDVEVPYTSSSELIGNIPSEVDMEGKLDFSSGKLLVDFYPIPTSGFHITGGLYFGGGDKLISLYNKTDGVLKGAVDYNDKVGANGDKIGLELGDYFLTPDSRGNVNARLEVKKVRPYVGLGFGRAIPGHRVGFMFELGAQFWGTPAVYCNDIKLEKDNVGDGDAAKAIKALSKISVYPVLNFRLSGKIF